MGREMATSAGLSYSAVDAIADRLSGLPELYLPHSSFAGRSDEVSNQEKKTHLVALLQRDAAIFLERYGTSLQLSELAQFEAIKDDYEVNWHLKQLKAKLAPSPEEQKSRAVAVKNRRLAFMEILIEDGQYFSEEAMRMRCPLLHHEYVGQFQDPATWTHSRRGDKLADVIIRQSEELLIQQRLEEERRQAGSTQEEEEEEEEEEDEDEEDENQAGKQELYIQELNALSCMQLSDAGPSSDHQEHNKHYEQQQQQQEVIGMQPDLRDRDQRLQEFAREMIEKFMAEDTQQPSEQDLEDKLDAFTRVMQEKFLSGEDSEHVDYARIDENAALDDHWLREVTQDAEEKYFEED